MKALQTSLARTLATTLLGAAVLLPCAASAHAGDQPETLGPNIVANGGFERGADPGVQLYVLPGSPFLENWTVKGSYLRVVGTYWQAEEGTRSLSLANPMSDIAKAMTAASGVMQTVPTTVGQRYRVTFYQAGNPWGRQPSTVRVVIGSQTHDYTYQSSASDTLKKMGWIERSLVYTATAVHTDIAFYGYITPGNVPLGLDNVQVRAIQAAPTATPVPGGTATQPGAGKSTLRLGAPSLAAGGQQTLLVHTARNGAVALVIDYPDGSQSVVPSRADATGAYSYSWAVPGVHGTVLVTVDGAGALARATFTIR